MDIGIIVELLEHEICHIGSRDVRPGADEERLTDPVYAGSGCIGEP
jgi:hypothetical protein